MATLSQISQISGVSVATASRILQNDTTLSVKNETRKKVLEAAEQLGYKAKAKKNQPYDLHFTAVFAYEESLELGDPYYLSIRMALEQECQRLKISLKKFYTVPASLPGSDGILAVGLFSSEQKEFLAAIQSNVIFIDSNTFPLYDCITPDLPLISHTILEYFNEHHYRRIGFIGGRDFPHMADERETAFLNFAKACGWDSSIFYVGEFTNNSGYEMALKMLSSPPLPDALFIANDSLAIGVLKALNEKAIEVPKQLAIISVNNIPASDFTYPPLTSIDIPSEFMGAQAVIQLKERILSQREYPLKILVPFSIIFRSTTRS